MFLVLCWYVMVLCQASSPRMRQAHTVTFRDNADIGRKAEVKVDGVTENLRRSDVGGFLSFFKKKKKVSWNEMFVQV